MQRFVYDFEVFCEDWLIVIKELSTRDYTVIHNDNDALRSFFNDHTEDIFIGFNSKGYDQYIAKGIVAGDFDNRQLKALNDWIIAGNAGWNYPELQDCRWWFNNVDIMDDVQKGLSLKAIEGHFGLSVEESDVDFTIDRKLTQEDLEQVIHYCKHDVDATEKLIEARKDYLLTKENLGKRAGIPPQRALAMTNAKLTAAMLHAKAVTRDDGREYVYPPNLDTSVIPAEILAFFDTIHDKTIPDDALFETSLDITLGNMPCKYAWGGVHGSLTGYYEESTDTRVVENRDVSSLYPSLIEIYGYLSRNVPDPELFYQIRRDRIKAKHEGNKQLAKDLKLPLNTVSGAQENQYNDLYDPLPTRSLRISGQLFLTVLTMRLLNACKTIKLLNLNTDGLMYSVDKSELETVNDIAAAWEKETKFELEVDHISKVWIKDVNNLLLIKTNGEVKTVGGYLNYGISVKGAWAINNTAVIIKKAIVEYFVHDTPVEDTIGNSTTIADFQIIAKAGSKYREAFQIVDGERVPVQKVNRVYATKDERYGMIYKVKAENGQVAKIEMLPEHCLIDNTDITDPSHTTTADIDKDWYIALAHKRINDYMGVKPQKGSRKMAAKAETQTPEYKSMNIYQKLLIARSKFLAAGAKKSGKNNAMKYLYFELDDIVPVVTPIFVEVGLLTLTTFTETDAVMFVKNVDNPDEIITFSSPMRPDTSGLITNEIQKLGSIETYQRRYLYMLALDIVEADQIEQTTAPKPKEPVTPPTPAKPAEPPKKTPPATPEKREEIKKELTNGEDLADKFMMTSLTSMLQKYKSLGFIEDTMLMAGEIKKAGGQLSKARVAEMLTKIKTDIEKEKGNAASAN